MRVLLAAFGMIFLAADQAGLACICFGTLMILCSEDE